MSVVCQQGNSCYTCKLRDQQCGWQVHNPACKTHACTHNESISVTLNQWVNTDKNHGFLKSHDSIKQRQRGGAGSTKKTLYVRLAGAPVKSLGGSEMLFFLCCFFFTRPCLCHLIFKCRSNWRRAPPRPPVQSWGISQRAPTRSTGCRASAWTGGTWVGSPTQEST